LRVRWDKVDRVVYRTKTETKLTALKVQIEDLPSDLITTRLNTILTECAKEACPPPPKRKRKTRFKWHASFKPAAERVSTCYREWRKTSPPKASENRNPIALKLPKKLLRKAQRKAAAMKRKDVNQAIIDACRRGDRDSYHKLIKRQRKPPTNTANIDFGDHEDTRGHADSWANYLTYLATPQDDESYDEEYQRHLQFTHLLQVLTVNGITIAPVTPDAVTKYIGMLKNGKACDIHGIAAEHIKLASPIITDILCHLVNLAVSQGKLPSNYKIGCVTPVHKKAKPAKLPTNYRRITISAIVGKITEKHMLYNTRPVLDPSQSRGQFGFSSGICPIFAAVIITELIANAKSNNEELYLTFLDTSKAFDVVSHNCMLNALHQQGVCGNLWQMYNDMYSGINSMVKWEGELSHSFEELQGIRQGGDSSADCYKAGKNRMLRQLDEEPSHKIGSINAGAVMVADDLAIASKNPHDMQAALSIAEIDASRERYKYNVTKTKTVVINSKSTPTFYLNNKPLELSTKEVHLGIHRTNTGSNTSTIQARIKDARQAAYSIRGAGLHGLNGAGPQITMDEYKTYIIPTLIYGLEALVLDRKDLDTLEAYHRKNLRYLQHLPQSTAVPAIHLLSGVEPIEALVDRRVLTLFRNIIAADAKTPPAIYIREIISRQLAVSDMDTESWTSNVRRTLAKYSLPSAFALLQDPPTKLRWKQMVKRAVCDEWCRKLQEEANNKSSLQLLNIDRCELGRVHPVWENLNAMEIDKATVKAQLLVKRYPLATSPTAGTLRVDTCPLCKEDSETTTHFLLQCPILREDRLPYLMKILENCRLYHLSIDPIDLTKIILDSSYLPIPDQKHEAICRNLIFKLHHRRSVMLGGGSVYKLARNKL
jgi:hypothetical protein